VPAGMVRYDHPVYRNGRLILWRGAWRSGGAGRKVAALATAPDRAAPDRTAPDRSETTVAVQSPPQKTGDYSILVDSDDAYAMRMASEFVAAMQLGGAKGHVIPGHASPAALATAVKSDSADLAIAPIDALIDNEQATADWRDRSPYIARLGSETVEVVTARTVGDIHQLAGLQVSFGAVDSAGAATAATLFSRLGVAAKPLFGPLEPALADLATGKFAAVVAVGAKSSKPLADFGKDGRFHVLSIPMTPELQALYAPVRLTANDQPNLIGGDETVETLSAPRALIAVDAAPSSPRAEQLAGLTKTFFESFDKLLGPDKDESWREVNLAAASPWPRLRAAQAWIDLNASTPDSSLNAFRAAAKTAALTNGGPSPQDSDRLYDSLMQWRSEGQ
jgi:TRAP-type uncharacterized transport system substrate-binding protein